MNIDFLHAAVVSLFIVQLLSISGYVSYRWRKSRTQLIVQYPQTRFPNLYVRPEHTELKRLKHRKLLDYLAATVGVGVLVFSIVFKVDTLTLSRYMIIVAGIQIIPILVSGYWCTKNCNEMKLRFPEKTRHTTMNQSSLGIRHHLLSFLSIVLFTISMMVCWMLISEAQDPVSVSKMTKLQWLNACVFLAILVMYLATMFGQKTDNFADPDEYEFRRRARQRYLSISMCFFQFFILSLLFAEAIGVTSVFITLVTSVLVQGIVISTKEQYFPINPNAYK